MNSVLGTGFRYQCQAKLPTGEVIEWEDHNLLPQDSVDHIARLILATTSPIGAWYVGIFEGNYTPTSGTSAGDLAGAVGECTAYSAANRPAWAGTYDNVSDINNAASRAVFTMTSDKRVYGAFIVSSSVKGGGSGVLLSIARFTVPRDLPAGTEFAVTAGIALVPTT